MIVTEVYGNIFSAKAQSFYAPGGEVSCPSVWIEPSSELYHSFESLKNIMVIEKIAKHHSVYVPAIENFLENRGVQALSFHAAGTSAATFRGLVTRDPYTQVMLRIGHKQRKILPPRTEGVKPNYEYLQKWNRPWCPLVLQPYPGSITSLAARSSRSYCVLQPQLELLPFVAVLPPGMARDLGFFINKAVLDETPYTVIEDTDVAAMRGGTPIYVDPSSVNFRTPELARQYAKDQFRPEYQQYIMGKIAKNTRDADLPVSWKWVVKQKDGRYVTSQSILYPDPLPPNRKAPPITRLVLH